MEYNFVMREYYIVRDKETSRLLQEEFSDSPDGRELVAPFCLRDRRTGGCMTFLRGNGTSGSILVPFLGYDEKSIHGFMAKLGRDRASIECPTEIYYVTKPGGNEVYCVNGLGEKTKVE